MNGSTAKKIRQLYRDKITSIAEKDHNKMVVKVCKQRDLFSALFFISVIINIILTVFIFK